MKGSDSWPLYAGMGIAGSAAVVASAFTLSDLADATGWTQWTSWLLPASVDVGGAVGGWVWLRPGAPDRARDFGRVIALSSAGASLAGNGLGHLIAAEVVRPSWPLIVAVGAVPAAVLVALAHLGALLSVRVEADPVEPDVEESTTEDRSTASAPSTPTVGPAVSVDLPPSPAPVGPAPTSAEVVDPPVKRAAALRSVRPSRPKVEVRADSRITGTDAEKVAALLAAVERGDAKAPLSAADVRSIVVAGGGKDRALRDEANARIAGNETSGDVT